MPKEYSFLQKVTWLFSGLFIVQIIHLVFSLLLPRIYPPGDFAVFGIFLSSIFILFEVNNYRLDQALMLPKDEAESLFIFRKAILFSTLTAVVIAIVWVAYSYSSFYNSSYADLKWIPISVFLQGVIQPSLSFSNKNLKYKLINFTRISQALTVGIVSCLPLFMVSKQVFLIQGFVAGQLIACIVFISQYFKKLVQFDTNNSYSIRPYIEFPKFGTLSSFLNTVSRNSIVYVLSIFFTPQMVGLYTFTNRLTQSPIGLITSAVGQAYFRDASQAKTKEELKELTENVQKILSQLAIIPVTIALFFGPALFEFLFGQEWRAAGEIARYLSFWYGTTLVVTPLSMLIDVKKRLKWELAYNAVFALTRISLLILAGMFFSFKWTIILFCAVSVVFNIYQLLFLKQLMKK